ncbi:GNAT family N-acetyltransferase [Candidatus Poribacteria bacterium]|nr:GNAT family N-acetyltransferase [Candidatus Poribacteria bacterium]
MYRANSAWWYICDLKSDVPRFENPCHLFVSRKADEDVTAYMRRKDYLTQGEMEAARMNGHWFFGLIRDGQVQGFRKCGFHRVFVNDFQETIDLPENVAFFYESEVDESLRNKGAGKYFMSSSLELVRKANYRFVICHVPSWNIPSQRIVERCGFKKMGFIRFIELAGLKYTTRNLGELIRDSVMATGPVREEPI